MCFRIDVERISNRTVVRVHGRLLGWEAERVLREQLVAAVAACPRMVLDLRELTAIDPGCLDVLERELIPGMSIEGGGAYLETLRRR